MSARRTPRRVGRRMNNWGSQNVVNNRRRIQVWGDTFQVKMVLATGQALEEMVENLRHVNPSARNIIRQEWANNSFQITLRDVFCLFFSYIATVK